MSVALRSAPPALGELAECLEDHRAPIAVRSVDLEDRAERLQLPASRSGTPYERLVVFVRRAGRPIGWGALPVAADGEVSLAALATLQAPVEEPREEPLEVSFAPAVHEPREAVAGPAQPRLRDAAEPAMEPLISIVVATCANPELVVRCVEAIQSETRGTYEVVVVENRPRGSTVARVLREHFGGDERIRYVEEQRPGLACARNAGLRAARGELVAFTDDDVIVDSAWVPAIRGAFAAAPEVACVTGLILPLELETPAQLLIERFAGYGKGFAPRIYSLEKPPPDQPLFPYTAGYFGSGANMAFRTGFLRDIGGFDPILGTGTPARGGEDLDICIRVLGAGAQLAYEPRAIIWHCHPDTAAHLRRRAFDYGTALGAMVSKHILSGPNRWTIFSRIPQGIRYYTDPASRKNAARGSAFPRGLARLERVGLLYGPLAYLASRVEARR
jgi:GT2 family glycosyltransferase